MSNKVRAPIRSPQTPNRPTSIKLPSLLCLCLSACAPNRYTQLSPSLSHPETTTKQAYYCCSLTRYSRHHPFVCAHLSSYSHAPRPHLLHIFLFSPFNSALLSASAFNNGASPSLLRPSIAPLLSLLSPSDSDLLRPALARPGVSLPSPPPPSPQTLHHLLHPSSGSCASAPYPARCSPSAPRQLRPPRPTAPGRGGEGKGG